MAGTTRVVGFWDVGQFVGQGLAGTVGENTNPFSTVPYNGADRERRSAERFWQNINSSSLQRHLCRDDAIHMSFSRTRDLSRSRFLARIWNSTTNIKPRGNNARKGWEAKEN